MCGELNIYKQTFCKMAKKQIIRLNESDFHKIVKNAVKSILSEDGRYNKHSGEKRLQKFLDDNRDELEKSYKFDSKSFWDEKLKDEQLNEGESGGWYVDSSEAQEAYNMFVNAIGKEEADAAIVRALGDNALADVLAYLFRMYDFREWDNRDEEDVE